MDAAREVCLWLGDQLTDCSSLQHLSETAERGVETETVLGVQRCTLLQKKQLPYSPGCFLFYIRC